MHDQTDRIEALPVYRCRKQVRAAKITHVWEDPNGATLHFKQLDENGQPNGPGPKPILVGKGFIWHYGQDARRLVGRYYVVDHDRFDSFCPESIVPADAFEHAHVLEQAEEGGEDS